jgi:glycosyltransferase involved in cell wall biosynthesis
MAPQAQPKVEVIIPARNEEDCLPRCLASIATQQGIDFHITVVDDNSTDRTRAIAEAFSAVRVVTASEPRPGVGGKNNALICGVQGVTAEWLLFTDADTFHYAGSLAAAVAEAEEHGADLLSYSPEQELGSWYEGALQPVIFAELARTYPPDEVNDPNSPIVAANGQYILVRRAAYESVDGHAAVSGDILEDVALARNFKQNGLKLYFKFGAGRVRTRMYRSFASMCEGWTKNLVRLFEHPLWLATTRGLEFLAIIASALASAALAAQGDYSLALIQLAVFIALISSFQLRIRRAHAPEWANLLALLGLPLFVSLLIS